MARLIIHALVLEKGNLEEISIGGRKTYRFKVIIDHEIRELKGKNRKLYPRIQVGHDYNLIYQELGNRLLGIEGDNLEAEDRYEIPRNLPPRNKSEAQLYTQLTGQGWDMTKQGWPDFACIKDGRLLLVEVKPSRSRRLKGRQQQLMELFASHGIDCFKWSPDGNFERIMPRLQVIT